MKFSYQFFRGYYFPIIPVTVVKDGKKINTSAVVDSGASISIFQGGFGRLINIDIESGEKRIFQGASAKLIGYIHNVKLTLTDKEFDCKIAFSDELSTSFNLLGRETVFDNFKVCFDEAERIVEFIPK